MQALKFPYVHLCIFKTLQLLDGKEEEMLQHLDAAIQQGVVIAEFYKWEIEYGDYVSLADQFAEVFTGPLIILIRISRLARIADFYRITDNR